MGSSKGEAARTAAAKGFGAQPRVVGPTIRWGIFISGRGSNLGALLELRGEIDVRFVVSSAPSAYGLLRAKRAGLPTAVTPFVEGSKKIDWVALDALLRAQKISHIFLLGFMKVVPASFVQAWRGRILNLHPSLLPSYPGLDSIGRAYRENAPLGVSVHEVNEEVDAGRLILQRRSLNAGEKRSYSPSISQDAAEFLVHVDEQRVVKEAVSRWKPVQIP